MLDTLYFWTRFIGLSTITVISANLRKTCIDRDFVYDKPLQIKYEEENMLLSLLFYIFEREIDRFLRSY